MYASLAFHRMECNRGAPRAAICDKALHELVCRDDQLSHLACLIEEEERNRPPPHAAEQANGFRESMLRVYQYSREFRLKADDGHHE